MKRILLSVPALMLAGNALGSVTMEISKPVDRPEKQAGEIQVIGHTFTADFGENRYSLYFPSETRMEITVEKGMGKNQVVDIERVRLGRDLYMVTWQETDRSTVTHIEDFGNGIVYSNITLPDMTFQNYKGTLGSTNHTSSETADADDTRQNNIIIVTRFLDLAFNKNDTDGAAALVTDRYIQHNPFVADGREGFIEGITGFHKAFPDISWKLKHVYVDGDHVITHSQYEEGVSYATVDIFRIKDGKIDEHWDVKQQIPAPGESVNNNTMF